MVIITMSSTRRYFGRCILLASILSVGRLYGQEVPGVPFGCPASLQGSVSLAPPAGWQAKTSSPKLSLQGVSIYNLREDGLREFELAPDESHRHVNHVTQLWNLGGYRTLKIYVRCIFDQQVSISREIPIALTTCQMEFDVDKLSRMMGSPKISCR
jgi:hypothetical protein